ncbi:MAG: hypothetical protein ABSH24_16435 [Bryobacteraceae bacterium]|jgi:hypothetical protein
MPNLQNLPSDTTALLEAVGGEPLAVSGFEAEPPEPGFAPDQPSIDDALRTERNIAGGQILCRLQPRN